MSVAPEIKQRTSIVLDVPFESNSVVDFNHLAEEKYGYETIHPNIVIADDLLVDDDADVEDGDDNNDEEEEELPKEPAPALNAQNPTQSAQTKKPKRMIGKYDLNDPFIDDAEMEWESQAAATRDGFFVYSGVIERERESTPPEKDTKKPGKRKKDESSVASANSNSTSNKKRKQIPLAKKKSKSEEPEGKVEADGNEMATDEKPEAIDADSTKKTVNSEVPSGDSGAPKSANNPNDSHETKEANETKESKEPKTTKEPSTNKEQKSSKGSKTAKEPKNPKETKEAKEPSSKKSNDKPANKQGGSEVSTAKSVPSKSGESINESKGNDKPKSKKNKILERLNYREDEELPPSA